MSRYSVVCVDLGQFAILDASTNTRHIRDGLPKALWCKRKLGQRYIDLPKYSQDEAQQVCDWLNSREPTKCKSLSERPASVWTLRAMMEGDKRDASAFASRAGLITDFVHLANTTPRFAPTRAIRRDFLAWEALNEFSGEAS